MNVYLYRRVRASTSGSHDRRSDGLPFRRFTLHSLQNMNVVPVDSSSPRIGTFGSFLRGGSTMRFSSRGLHWTFIDLESHVVPPREVPEGMTGHLLLMQWQGNSVARGEYQISRGRRVPYAKRPTTLSLISQAHFLPAGPQPNLMPYCVLLIKTSSTRYPTR